MTKVKNIALVAGSSVALFAGSLAVAPVAKADCAPWELQACWGAIAYSPKTGVWGSDINASEQSHAVNDAKIQCAISGPTNDCVVVIWGTACMALATNNAGGGQIVTHVCVA